MKRKNQRGFTPSPLIRTMFGSFANITLQRQYHKPAPIDSVYPPPPPYPPGPPCPCNTFKILDAAYTALSPEERQVWRDALKKPGISAYNLFMKENLVAAMRDGKLVTCPSVSGGYSCQSLELAEEPPVWENTIGLAPPYVPPPPTEPPPGDNDCGICDGTIPNTLYVYLEGLGGCFEVCNGRWAAVEADCWWWMDIPDMYQCRLSYTAMPATWQVKLNWTRRGICHKRFRFNGVPEWDHCKPWIYEYPPYACNRFSCRPGSSCDDSEDATCYVDWK